MIAKLAVWADTRERAAAKLDRALSEYIVNGVTTNVTFLRRIVQHEAFRSGDTQTDFIERHFPAGPPPIKPAHLDVAMIAATIRQYEYSRELADQIVKGSREDGGPSQWRLYGRRAAFKARERS
jgi:acetyl/propionyl-CoA carboxylase alpha subunit